MPLSLLRTVLRAWLRALPLQRRVAYLTTAAVALAVAVTSVAGYLTLRISLYRALDAELVERQPRWRWCRSRRTSGRSAA